MTNACSCLAPFSYLQVTTLCTKHHKTTGPTLAALTGLRSTPFHSSRELRTGSESFFELAAAKRGGRGRGRPTLRGRASANQDELHAATPNGDTLEGVSFSLPEGSDDASADARRTALLRRLNQITQEKSRLERLGRRDKTRTHGIVNGDVHDGEADDYGHDRVGWVGVGTRKADRENGTRESRVNGSGRVSHSTPKRRRGEPVDSPHKRNSGDAERGAETTNVPHRNGRHDSHKRIQAGSEKNITRTADQGRVEKRSDVEKLDLMVIEEKRAAPATPPTTPGIGSRGSTRVRTPSVLLSSHPGEKVQPLKPSAASKNRQVAYCLRIVKDMLRLKDAFGFSKPIDQLWSRSQLPGYFEMIKTPMDLDTVRQRLESGHYLKSPGKEEVEEVTFDGSSFAADMRLIFNNARTYNRSGDVFHEAATRLLEKFETRWAQMPSAEQLAALAAKKNKKRRKGQSAQGAAEDRRGDSAKRRKSTDLEVVVPPKRKPSSKKKAPTGSGGKARPPSSGGSRKKSTPKTDAAPAKDVSGMSAEELEARLRALERRRNLTQPGSPAASAAGGQAAYLAEAQALYHVEVSYEEKVQIIENVQKLPPDKLRKVISMAKKTSTSMEVNMNEEVELDIEAMDNKTLRDIQALVNQTLRSKKGHTNTGPNSDVLQMQHADVLSEIDKVRTALRKLGRSKSSDGKTKEKEKGQKSFYDSDSSSDSDDSDGSGSDSDDSSSGDSDSSGDESGSEFMRKTRERNLAHQQAMRASGTPLPSPSYQGQGG